MSLKQKIRNAIPRDYVFAPHPFYKCLSWKNVKIAKYT